MAGVCVASAFVERILLRGGVRNKLLSNIIIIDYAVLGNQTTQRKQKRNQINTVCCLWRENVDNSHNTRPNGKKKKHQLILYAVLARKYRQR